MPCWVDMWPRPTRSQTEEGAVGVNSSSSSSNQRYVSSLLNGTSVEENSGHPPHVDVLLAQFALEISVPAHTGFRSAENLLSPAVIAGKAECDGCALQLREKDVVVPKIVVSIGLRTRTISAKCGGE